MGGACCPEWTARESQALGRHPLQRESRSAWQLRTGVTGKKWQKAPVGGGGEVPWEHQGLSLKNRKVRESLGVLELPIELNSDSLGVRAGRYSITLCATVEPYTGFQWDVSPQDTETSAGSRRSHTARLRLSPTPSSSTTVPL